MPAKKAITQKEEIAMLKEQVVAYYSKLPILKYAAMSVARNEDTVLLWRKEDPDFSDKLQKAKAAFLMSKVNKVKSEFYLERQFREEFGANLDITSKGEKITPILGGGIGIPGDDGDPQDSRAEEAD